MNIVNFSKEYACIYRRVDKLKQNCIGLTTANDYMDSDTSLFNSPNYFITFIIVMVYVFTVDFLKKEAFTV